MPNKTLNRRNNTAGSTLEDALFWLANEECSYGDIRQGLWREALMIADGNELKARSEYLKLRVKTLQDENEITQPASTDTEIDENDSRRFTIFRSAQQENQELSVNELAWEDNSGLWPRRLQVTIAKFAIFSVIILIGLIDQ